MIDIKKFKKVGESFARKYPDTSLGDCVGVFWWDDETPLLEFSLVNQNKKTKGFVLVNSNPSLPPIMECSYGDNSLFSSLNSYLNSMLIDFGLIATSVKWYYLSALEPVAKVLLVGDDLPVLFRIPSMESYSIESKPFMRKSTELLISKTSIKESWKNLTSDSAVQRKVLSSQPIKYQQGCDGYSLSETLLTADPGNTYCSPHCIAGCAPVAWAGLASAWKKHGQSGANTKIYPGSTCWNQDWPSTSKPNICDIVSETIWAIHSRCSTSCSGSTSYDTHIFGESWFNDKWHLPWKFYKKSGYDFTVAKDTIDKGQPHLFGAQGQWDSLIQNFEPKDLAPLGKVGHCVTIYGYDTNNSQILISLGWGRSFADKWIPINNFSDRIGLYVTSWNKNSLTETEMSNLTEPAFADTPFTSF